MPAEQERFQAVNQAGYEAYQLIEKRMRELGPLEFMDFFVAVVGAANVCLANALRPGIEAGKGRAAVADKLIASSLKQVRALVEPAVKEGGDA
jgi:hypothetical protein